MLWLQKGHSVSYMTNVHTEHSVFVNHSLQNKHQATVESLQFLQTAVITDTYVNEKQKEKVAAIPMIAYGDFNLPRGFVWACMG